MNFKKLIFCLNLILLIMGSTSTVYALQILEGIKNPFKKNYKYQDLLQAIKVSDTETISKCIQSGISLNTPDAEGKTPLHFAAINGKVKIVNHLKALNANLKAKDNIGATALHWAAARGHIQIVKNLVNSNIDVEAKDNNGATALHWAASNGHTQVIVALKEMGANLNAQTHGGVTALHCACENNHIEAIFTLIKLGTALEAQDNDGAAALHWAAGNGHVQAIVALKDHNVNLRARTHNQATALHCAAEKGFVQAINEFTYCDLKIENITDVTVTYLASMEGYVEPAQETKNYSVNKGNLDMLNLLRAKNGDGNTALHLAAMHGHIEAVNELVNKDVYLQPKYDSRYRLYLPSLLLVPELKDVNEQSANLEISNNEGNTPLHLAAIHGYAKIIETLYNQGANLEALNHSGNTTLHLAAMYGHLESVQTLHRLGTDLIDRKKKIFERLPLLNHVRSDSVYKLRKDLTIKNNKGETPLALAISKCHLDIARLLRDLGADLEMRSYNGNTALHRAAAVEDVETIKILCYLRADWEAKNDDSDTVIHCAAAKGHTEVIKILKEFNISKNYLINRAKHTPFMTGLEKGFFIKELLAQEDINAVLENGLTQLSIAAKHGDIKMMQLLIAHGADIYAKDAKGHTAEDWAIYDGQEEVIQFFVTYRYNQALLRAAKKGDIERIKKFLICGAYINHLDEHKHPPIYYAILKTRLAAIDYLLEQRADLGLLDNTNLALVRTLLLRYKPAHKELLIGLLILQEDIHQQDAQGQTLLHLAARYADRAFVEFLCEQVLDPLVVDTQGQTILHCAVENEDADANVFDHIARNCQRILHTVNLWGETALHKAARLGRLRVIELCNEYKFDFLATNHAGQTPLDIAREHDHPEVVIEHIAQGVRWNNPHTQDGVIIQYVDMQDLNRDRATLLQEAIAQGDVHRVYTMHSHGADLDAIDPNDLTFVRTLLTEYKPQYYALLEALLARYYNLYERDESGQTILHLGACYGDTAVWGVLLRYFRDPCIYNQQGQTPLHAAAQNPNSSVFRHIAHTHPTLLPITDNAGETALHAAARSGHIHVEQGVHQGNLGIQDDTFTSTPSTTARPSIYSACEGAIALEQKTEALLGTPVRSNDTQTYAVTVDDDDDPVLYIDWLGGELFRAQIVNPVDDDEENNDGAWSLEAVSF